MVRPRRHSDEELITAAAETIVAREDGAWSLADVAAHCGMSPAALVKRFGSKQELLRRVTRHWVEGLPAYGGSTDPLGVIRGFVDTWLAELADPATARGHFLLLAAEVADPAARELVAEGRARQAAYLDAALADAAKQGRLRRPAGAGALLLDLLTGRAVGAALGSETDADPIHRLIDSWRLP